jgi:hypothetical protein
MNLLPRESGGLVAEIAKTALAEPQGGQGRTAVFETVFVGLLQEMTAEIESAARSREKTAGNSGGFSEPEAREPGI